MFLLFPPALAPSPTPSLPSQLRRSRGAVLTLLDVRTRVWHSLGAYTRLSVVGRFSWHLMASPQWSATYQRVLPLRNAAVTSRIAQERRQHFTAEVDTGILDYVHRRTTALALATRQSLGHKVYILYLLYNTVCSKMYKDQSKGLLRAPAVLTRPIQREVASQSSEVGTAAY